MVTTSPANSPYVMTRPQSLFHKAVMGGVYTDVLFCAGRGAGKTTAGARQIIRLALERPGTRWIIVAPTYPMLRDVDIYEVMRWLPPAYIRSYNRTEHLLTLTTGSEIAFRSADNADSLRGANRDGAWFDEPRNLKSRDAFDIVSAQLRPNRLLFMTTTPAGIFHWLYDLFVANPIPHSTVIYGKTADNFHLPPEYEARLRVQYTGKFAQQELDALWTSFEGLVYDNFSVAPDGNVSDTAEYDPNLPILIGVDDGYAEGDGVGTASYHPRVIVLGQATAQGGLNIFAEYVTTNELPESSIRRVLEAYPKPQAAYVDSSAADIRMLLAGMGIYVVPATHKVSEGIKFVRRLLCDGNNVRLIKIHPRCKHLIRELQTYRYDDRMRSVSAGELPPLKLDDHSADALRYLCQYFKGRMQVK